MLWFREGGEKITEDEAGLPLRFYNFPGTSANKSLPMRCQGEGRRPGELANAVPAATVVEGSW